MNSACRFYFQVSIPAIPGSRMEFLINTRFEVTGVGCSTFKYLCVELDKGDNPDPDFIFNEARRGRPIVTCEKIPCRGKKKKKTKKKNKQINNERTVSHKT